uniref:Secreted protein n=1 Tax=Molossus molossus TaxID=27622 RepID=A0A7J8DBS9_MOLMO|nr:hypothetical protein HJG59_009327 [Molossus molossus]
MGHIALRMAGCCRQSLPCLALCAHSGATVLFFSTICEVQHYTHTHTHTHTQSFLRGSFSGCLLQQAVVCCSQGVSSGAALYVRLHMSSLCIPRKTQSLSRSNVHSLVKSLHLEKKMLSLVELCFSFEIHP